MNNILNEKTLIEALKKEALKMAVACVRNTVIEEYHSGITPRSKTGNYSDVKVITPYGEIPWNDLSRISDDEMMVFNKEVVNLIFTYLQCLLNPHFDNQLKQEFMGYANACYPNNWDESKIETSLINIFNRKQ